jgi:hypothetical protein
MTTEFLDVSFYLDKALVRFYLKPTKSSEPGGLSSRIGRVINQTGMERSRDRIALAEAGYKP